MKILHVAHGLPPKEKAGVQVYVADLATEQGARHDVAVFAPAYDRDLPDFSEYEEDFGRFRAHRIVNHFTAYDVEKELYQPEIEVRFRRYLEERRPDAVHVHHLLNLSASLMTAVAEARIPLVLTLHDYWFLCPLYTLLRRDLRRCEYEPGAMVEKCVQCDVATAYLNPLYAPDTYLAGVLSEMEGAEVIGDLEAIYRSDFRPVFREWAEEGGRQYRERRAWLQAHMSRNLLRADLVVAPSRHMRDAFARAGVPAERLVHRPYGIRAAALAEVGSRRRRSGDGTAVAPGEATAAREAGGAARGAGPLRVAFLGTLTKHKGVHVLLRAFEGLPAGRARLRIHGWTVDRRYREWLRTLSARPDVEWRGEVERDDLPAVFAETDVLVVPSTWVENCPIVIQEAYLAGVPVVASNVGALPEFVRDGESGLLFEVENPDSLRRTLLRILDDPGLLERLRAGIPAVRPMDDEARYFEEAYARLVGERVRMHAERPAS